MNNDDYFDDKDLVPLHLALKTLMHMGLEVSAIADFTSAPGTDLECPALMVRCRSRDLVFQLILEGHGGETTLQSRVNFFDDFLAIGVGDPEDLKVRAFISWLEKNSPTKIAIQRTYGRLAGESEDLEMPLWPTREAIGGSVSIYVPLMTPQMVVDSVHIASEDEPDLLRRALNSYFHTDAFTGTQLLRLPEVIPAVLAFMHEALVEAGVGATSSLVEPYP